MKKYVKPELYYENMELTQHVVANCALELTQAQGSCGVQGELELPGNITVSVNASWFDVAPCTTLYESICYYNGTDSPITINVLSLS